MKSHGACKNDRSTPEYQCWIDIKRRCNDPRRHNYRLYGARGISVCDRWMQSFENFLEDIGPRPGDGYSINRIDNDGNYEPGNVEWATTLVQGNNRRNNIKQNVKGQILSLAQIAKRYGFNRTIIKHRYHAQNLRGDDLIKPLGPTSKYSNATLDEIV